MKTLTVELSEDVYERAERRAAAHGTTLPQQATQLLREFANSQEAAATTASGGDVSRLFAALDKARNVKSVGSLRRDELYDRDVLPCPNDDTGRNLAGGQSFYTRTR